MLYHGPHHGINTGILLEDYRPVQACTAYRKTAAGVKFKLSLVTGIAAIRSGR
eukprot:SAG31_NODE_372_length_16598_cov_44.705982_4_plen_53_part_00